MRGVIAVAWGLLGVGLLLTSAVYRLTIRGLDAFSQPLTWYHWLTLVSIILFMAYSEGYRGFQKAFSPRVAARARYLKCHASWLEAWLAPLFLMGYFGTHRRRQILSIGLTLGIILLVLMVRLVPQPWRGLIDVGVAVGLGWGLLSLLLFTFQALTAPSFDHSPEIPGFEGATSRG